MAANPLSINLATGAIGQTISWTDWAVAAFVPGLVSLLVVPLLLYVIYPPTVKTSPHALILAKENLDKMGSMSKNEKIMAATPVVIVGVWIFCGANKVDAATSAILGCLGVAFRNICLLWLYLVIMFLLILLLFVFTIFAFAVTNKTARNIVGNKASNWEQIERCIFESKYWSRLTNDCPVDKYLSTTSFSAVDLSPIKSGCSILPSARGCTYVNATFWSPCTNIIVDTDCGAYKIDSTTLCYTCNSCKAEVLQNITKDWRKVAIVAAVECYHVAGPLGDMGDSIYLRRGRPNLSRWFF